MCGTDADESLEGIRSVDAPDEEHRCKFLWRGRWSRKKKHLHLCYRETITSCPPPPQQSVGKSFYRLREGAACRKTQSALTVFF